MRQAWIAPVVLAPLYGPGALLSGLAPYFLPSTSYALITVGIFFLDARAKWFLIALGFLTAFHIVSTWAETSYRQPYIQQAGPVFSTFFFQLPTSLLSVGFLHLCWQHRGSFALLARWVLAQPLPKLASIASRVVRG